MNDDDNMVNIPMTSVLFVICLCGVGGNAFVLGVGIFKRRYQNNVTNCYIMNLAITDLLFLLISVPLTIYLSIRRIWIFGEFMCKMHIYLAHVLLQATCYTLALMSIDRYLKVAHEVWYRRYRKPKHALMACILIWIVSSLFMFPYGYVLHSSDERETNQSSITVDCTVTDIDSFSSSCFFTFTFYYVLPLTIIGLCYSRISVRIRRSQSQVGKQLSYRLGNNILFRRRRVHRMLLGLTLAFALCWLPIHVIELIHCSQLLSSSFTLRHINVLTTARVIAHGLSYFNSCLNPILYAILSKNYFYTNP